MHWGEPARDDYLHFIDKKTNSEEKNGWFSHGWSVEEPSYGVWKGKPRHRKHFKTIWAKNWFQSGLTKMKQLGAREKAFIEKVEKQNK